MTSQIKHISIEWWQGIKKVADGHIKSLPDEVDLENPEEAIKVLIREKFVDISEAIESLLLVI